MTKQDVKKTIYDGVGAIVFKHGFKLNKTEGSFIREIPDGWQSIGIAVVDYRPKFKASLTVSIRLDAVEYIVHMFSGAPTKYHSLSPTFISRLDRFTTSDAVNVTMMKEEDVRLAISRWESIIRERIIPFLDQHNDLKSVAEAMSLMVIPQIVSGAGEALHAITVARLAGDVDFNKVAAGYLERMKLLPQEVQMSVHRLVDYLRSIK